MQKKFELKQDIVVDGRVKISRRMQALHKGEQGIQLSAYKIKAREEKIQQTFQIDPYISVDKKYK